MCRRRCVSGPSLGTLRKLQANQVTYTPALNFSGTDSFSFRAFDGERYSSAATVSIDVTPVSHAPVASADSATTSEDAPVIFSATANDTDVDGNLNVASVDLAPPTAGRQTSFTVAGQGTFSVNDAGLVTFNPALNFNGTVQIGYTVSDTGTPLLSAHSTLTVTVTRSMARRVSPRIWRPLPAQVSSR